MIKKLFDYLFLLPLGIVLAVLLGIIDGILSRYNNKL